VECVHVWRVHTVQLRCDVPVRMMGYDLGIDFWDSGCGPLE